MIAIELAVLGHRVGQHSRYVGSAGDSRELEGQCSVVETAGHREARCGSETGSSFGHVCCPGRRLDKEEVFGTVEAVKTVSDLFLPLSGEIVAFNESLEDEPEKVNSDPYGEGWMIKIKLSDASEIEDLMTDDDYKELIGA